VLIGVNSERLQNTKESRARAQEATAARGRFGEAAIEGRSAGAGEPGTKREGGSSEGFSTRKGNTPKDGTGILELSAGRKMCSGRQASSVYPECS